MEIFNQINLLFLGRGLLITLRIAGLAILFSLILGTGLGILRYYYQQRRGGRGLRWAGRFAALYIEIMRNLPMFLLILAARLMTPLTAINAGILGITLFTSAVMAEIIRGGLNAIDSGQWEAARSQGFSTLLTLRHIILPQAFRKVIPPLVSQFTTAIKDSAYVWGIGVEELTGRGLIILGQGTTAAQVMLLFGFIALVYFFVNYSMSQAVRWWEQRQALLS